MQSEEFIRLCQQADDEVKSYFQVIRNPEKAVYHWKDELEKGQISRVVDFVSDPVPGAFFTTLMFPDTSMQVGYEINNQGDDKRRES